MDFQKLLLEFRAIERKVHIPPGLDVFENDVEHSYSLAMMAWFLAGYFPKLDVGKAIQLALAHDLVEVHAGDTFSYAEEHILAGKEEREAAALKKLAAEWRDFPCLIKNIEDYKARKSPEAKFVYALDKLIPALIDYMNEGRGWRHLGISFTDFCAEKDKKIPISPEIQKYSQELIAILDKQQHLFHNSSQ
jgi:putative hydrolase of HD superfamily